MKHTKGKWKLHSGEALKVKDSEENNICLMSFTTNFFRRDPEEVFANAELISKAPEMYEALKTHVDDCINSGAEIPAGFESLLKEIES